MTAVRLWNGATYGAKLYAYLLGVTLLGGVGLALGGALLWPELEAWWGPGHAEQTIAAAGGVLMFLGFSVLAVGYLGGAYKMLADAVRAGTLNRSHPVGDTEPVEEADREPNDAGPDYGSAGQSGESGSIRQDRSTDGPRQAPGIDPESPVDQPTEAAIEDGPHGEDAGSSVVDDPPEPSPGEIAFGSKRDETSESQPDTTAAGDAGEESAEFFEDDSTTSSSESVRPAGSDANSDPLADPSEDN